MAAINYVKFVRGTNNAFNNLAEKNSDTLYFISDSDEARGSLYLGSKLISKDISNLSELNDIAFEKVLSDGQILVYDEQNSKWINKAIVDAIGLMIGATSTSQGGNGLVPAPGIGQQDLFLRGDGTWAAPQTTLQLQTDNKSISILDDSQTLTIKNFGSQYYKYIPATDSVEAHYELQIVDATHPWKADLEPKVVEENGELVIGWFEPNLTTIEEIQDNLNDLSNEIETLKQLKADKSEVYSKEETDTRITQEVAKVNHLKRKTFNSLEEAEMFIYLEEHPENYIYLILNEENLYEDNKYDEYMYLDGVLEKVGSWNVDLNDYATKEELNIVNSKVNSIEALLNSKADKTEVESIDKKVTSLSDLLGTVNTKVNSLESFMNSDYFITKEDYQADITELREAVTWKDL